MDMESGDYDFKMQTTPPSVYALHLMDAFLGNCGYGVWRLWL